MTHAIPSASIAGGTCPSRLPHGPDTSGALQKKPPVGLSVTGGFGFVGKQPAATECGPPLHVDHIRVGLEFGTDEPVFAGLDLELDDVVLDQHANMGTTQGGMIEANSIGIGQTSGLDGIGVELDQHRTEGLSDGQGIGSKNLAGGGDLLAIGGKLPVEPVQDGQTPGVLVGIGSGQNLRIDDGLGVKPELLRRLQQQRIAGPLVDHESRICGRP